MGRLVVTEFMTVDGVMEAPGFDEHRSGRNAWALRLSDDEMQAFNRDQLLDADALLLGRTTYQIWAAFWPSLKDEESFGRRVNELPKYVVSKSLARADWAQHDRPPRRPGGGGRRRSRPGSRARSSSTGARTWSAP